MNGRVEVTVSYQDVHLLRLKVTATNDQISAVTEVYLSKDKLESFRSALDGFQSSATDCRYAALGDVGEAGRNAKLIGADDALLDRLHDPMERCEARRSSGWNSLRQAAG
jgi:hypothetical protein